MKTSRDEFQALLVKGKVVCLTCLSQREVERADPFDWLDGDGPEGDCPSRRCTRCGQTIWRDDE